MYNMIPYKSKVIHVDDGILKVSSIIKNINVYPRKETNCGNESIVVLLYDKDFGDTIIAGNTDLTKNIIL